MNREMTARSRSPVTPTKPLKAAPPVVTGAGTVKKSAPHKRVKIPASLG